MAAEKIRFHLDEHIDPQIAESLRRHGINATTTVEAGLRTADDLAQLSYAQREARVFVTDDVDFLRLAAANLDHPGIVFCDRKEHSMGQIIRGLVLIYEVLEPDEMAGRVEFL